MVTFDHEKLEAYQLAVEYADIAEEIALKRVVEMLTRLIKSMNARRAA